MENENISEAIKERLDIVEVISDYLELRRAGQNYKGLCPFHTEKTPSFIVSPGKQVFHCFGCGAGGDAIGFVMKHENLSFFETLTMLAKRVGITVVPRKKQSEEDSLRQKLFSVHEEALQVFTANLKRSQSGAEYLSQRGIDDETIRRFSLGCALKDWRALSHHLSKKGFPAPLLIQSGLVLSGSKGVYDTFRDRIIFPIHDAQGAVTAFGGRVLDEALPKYLNSPETPIFRKSETLYGLSQAKEGIRKRECAMVVEGYFDVLICHQYGFDNAVAPLGTALTRGHLRKLKRFTHKVVVVFDGDAAGIAAAVRSMPLLLEEGFRVRVVILPEGEDPDSFLRKHGAADFSSRLSHAQSETGFLLSVSKKDQTDTIRDALTVISSATDMIVREALISELSEKTRIREVTLRAELKKLRGRSGEKKQAGAVSVLPVSRRTSLDEELLLLSIAIAFPDRKDDIIRRVPVELFRNAVAGNVLRKIAAGAAAAPLSEALSEEERELLTRLMVQPGFDPEHVDKNIEDCIRKITVRSFDEQLREAERAGDLRLLNTLALERNQFISKTSLKHEEKV